MSREKDSPPDGLDVVCMDDIEPREVEWLVPERAPVGMTSLLVGDPGLGKTTLALYWAAQLTRGEIGGDLRDVVVLACEDALHETLRPRLDRLDADPKRVHVIRSVHEKGKRRQLSLSTDLEAVEQVITNLRAGLLIVDPLSAYLGARVNEWRNSDVRSVVDPISEMTSRLRIATLGLVHLTKAQDQAALYRAQGSIAFVAAARSVMLLSTDPDDDDETSERRLLHHVKCSVAPKAPVRELWCGASIRWGETRKVSTREALAAKPRERDGNLADRVAVVIADVVKAAGGIVRVDIGRREVVKRCGSVGESTITSALRIAGVDRLRPPVVGGPWHWSCSGGGGGETGDGETDRTHRSPVCEAESPSHHGENGAVRRVNGQLAYLAPLSSVSPLPVSPLPPHGEREPGDDDPDEIGGAA